MQLYSVLLSLLLFYNLATHASSTTAAAGASTSTIANSASSSSSEKNSNNNTETPVTTTSETEEEEDPDPFQPSLDAISLEWQQICDMGCQPGTWPSDSNYISNYVVPELISIQYKANCSAKSAHMKYLREIFECSGRRDLCLELDKKTMKCRDTALRKVAASLKHLGENAMDCEKDEVWQEEFYDSVLRFMRYFKSKMCRGVVDGEVRDCTLMGTCMSTIQDF